MKRLIIVICAITGLLKTAQSSTILASSYGFDSTDATSSLQSAILSGADTVIIDAQNANWIIRPCTFTNLNNVFIKVEPGVVIHAKSAAYPNSGDCLFKFRDCSNIKISGYRATLQMQKDEYTTGEWRHAISLLSSTDVVIEGLTIKDSGGDGIYVGAWSSGEISYCSDITIQDCICDNNYRQGISVISVENLYVKYCEFKNTNGTPPEAGVDIEPNDSFNRIVNVNFSNCRFLNNNGNGVKFALANLDSSSIPVTVFFSECYITDNGDTSNPSATSEIRFTAKKTGAVKGKILFERCLVENSKWTAVFCRKTWDSYSVTFNQSVFRDVSKSAFEHNEPLRIEVTDYANPCPRFGGIAFNDCLLMYQSDFTYLGVYDAATTPGAGDVTGNITVISANTFLPDYGSNPQNVTLTENFIPQLPLQSAAVYSADSAVNEGETDIGQFLFSRTGDDMAFPLAIKYATSGDARYGSDYHHLSLFKIIPSNMNAIADTLIALKDDEKEDIEICTVKIKEDDWYQLGSDDSVTLYIGLILSRMNEPERTLACSIYPNPCNDLLHIDRAGAQSLLNYIIYNIRGEIIRQGMVEDNMMTINLPEGIYFIKIMQEGHSGIYKLFVSR